MLEVGAFFMRTETELILKSRRVVPARLLEHGFVFRFPSFPAAARDLCRQWNTLRAAKPSAAPRAGAGRAFRLGRVVEFKVVLSPNVWASSAVGSAHEWHS